MDKLLDEIQKNNMLRVSVWGVLPIVFCVTFLLCIVAVKNTKRDKESALEELFTEKESYKLEKIYYTAGVWSKLYLLICVTLGIIPLVNWGTLKYASYIQRNLGKASEINCIVIGLTTMTITMAVIIIALDKRYYIFFSIREVLQRYRFAEVLMLLIISCILAAATSMTLLDNNIHSLFDYWRLLIMEISVIYTFVCAAYSMFVIIKIMFSDQNGELILLKKLYRRFWLHKIDTTHFKEQNNWNIDAIEINIDYLLDGYKNLCKKKKISKIQRIEFGTTLGEASNKWYKWVCMKFVRWMMILLIISSVINFCFLKITFFNIVCVLNIFAFLISLVIVYRGGKAIKLVLLLLYADTWGYFIYINKKNEKMIPRASIMKDNVYNKYIKCMNSLNAFFYIWINYNIGQNDDIIIVFEEVLQKIEKWDNKNMVTYFPIFTIAFFLYDKGIAIEKVRKLYNKFVVRTKKQDVFVRMLDSQILYLTKNFYIEKFGYRKSFDKYLNWLQMGRI